MKLALMTLFFVFHSSVVLAACSVFVSNGSLADKKGDALYAMLSQVVNCPQNVQDFSLMLTQAGMKRTPSMVANRGRNNPELGSFSLFETVTGAGVGQGEFYFGHFTDAHHKQIVLDQKPAPRKLLIELIAWDYQQKVFNFYELIGQDQKSAQWFYRGNSFDALADNKNLHRGLAPKFGTRMRCSACHTSGGPIMKELAFPHNDWWTKARALPFGSNTPSAELTKYMKDMVPAEGFAAAVKKGIHKLEASPTYQTAKSAQTLQEQLRPLFCEVEINLESNLVPLEMSAKISIPSAALISPLLGQTTKTMSKADYLQQLQKYKMRFPETNHSDADHAWLTPVKGYSDLLAIVSLVNRKVITEEFAKAILAVDVEKPAFSQARCSLLAFVPNSPTPGWQEKLLQQLPQVAPSTMNDFEKLLAVRAAVFRSEISQNPKGQILEPGFRVIFPESALGSRR